MAEFATVLKKLATKVAHELGEAASAAEHRLMHSTGENLEGSARAHQDNDEHHSSQFSALHPDASGAPSPHDSGGTSPTSATPGPSASPVAPPRGAQPGDEVPSGHYNDGDGVGHDTLPVGTGGRRTLEDQLNHPELHPTTAPVVDPHYSPFAGSDGPQDFRERHWDENGGRDGTGEWRWPPDDGAAPHSRTFVHPHEVPPLDRIGGDGGAYFSPQGTPFSQRAIPPDRLNFERRDFSVDTTSPHFANGDIRVERSDIAAAFGQDGGGVQYRFLDRKGNAISTGELRDTYHVIG